MKRISEISYIGPGLILLLLFTSLTRVEAKGNGGPGSSMVYIASGIYKPFLKDNNTVKPVKVNSFYIDAKPVTNREFLAFVKANPKWQRSKAGKLFADKSYLRHWKGDLEPGSNVNADAPVTNVSWFAAKAYSEWKGKRLPTIAEWEYAAKAVKDSRKGPEDMNIKRQILSWYSKPVSENLRSVGTEKPNRWGIYDMFGLVWEWVEDFNSILSNGGAGGDSDLNLYCGNAAASTTDPYDYAAFMRFAFRSSLKADYTVFDLGFRCAMDAK